MAKAKKRTLGAESAKTSSSRMKNPSVISADTDSESRFSDDTVPQASSAIPDGDTVNIFSKDDDDTRASVPSPRSHRRNESQGSAQLIEENDLDPAEDCDLVIDISTLFPTPVTKVLDGQADEEHSEKEKTDTLRGSLQRKPEKPKEEKPPLAFADKLKKQRKPDEQPFIDLRTVDEAEKQVRACHETIVQTVQKLVASIAGRRCSTAAEDIELAKRINHLAQGAGVDLVIDEKPACMRWRSRVFEARATETGHLSLGTSARFPMLRAQSKFDRE